MLTFLLYLTSVMMLIPSWLRNAYSSCWYVMATLSALMLLQLVRMRPYSHFIDNLTATLNLLLIIAFLLYLLVKDQEVLITDEQTDSYVCFGLTMFILVCCILTVARVIRGIVIACQKCGEPEEGNLFLKKP